MNALSGPFVFPEGTLRDFLQRFGAVMEEVSNSLLISLLNDYKEKQELLIYKAFNLLELLEL